MATTLPSKAKAVTTIRDYIVTNQRQIEMALPQHLSGDRFIRTAFTAFNLNPRLYDCSTQSLLGALVQLAQLGLEPGVLGHAYLVPFKNRRKGTTEVTVIPGYKGLLNLARNSGQISTIAATCVYDGDEFFVSHGTDPRIVHNVSGESIVYRDTKGNLARKTIVAVYAVAKLKDGGIQFEAMTREEVEYHRDRYSKSAGEGPWVDEFEEMAKKTVLRKLCKLLPASIQLQRAVGLDEYAESGIPQDLGAIIATSVDEDPEPPEPTKIAKLTEHIGEKKAAPEPEEAPDPAAGVTTEFCVCDEPDPVVDAQIEGGYRCFLCDKRPQPARKA